MIKNKTLLINQIQENARYTPEKIALRFLHGDYKTVSELTYQELNEQMTHLAAIIQQTVSTTPILLLFDSSIDYVVAFLSCLMAGRIAVTAYPPRKTRHLSRLNGIIDNSQINTILTHSTIKSFCEQNKFDFGNDTHIITTDHLPQQSVQFTAPQVDKHDIAFLQYTSGSTGSPKGVMVTHNNIVENLGVMNDILGSENIKTCISWLPIFHDMGLIAATLLPLYTGNTIVFMAPMTFLKRPYFWLEAMSKYQGNYALAPNFAYELAMNSLPEDADLDLSTMCHLINGAEPVKANTLREFEERLSHFGLKRKVLKPAYGMAETTLAIAINTNQDEFIIQASAKWLDKGVLKVAEEHEAVSEMIRCGIVAKKHYEILIVSPETQLALKQGEIGEIWIKGESVAQGYYQNKEKTDEIFNAYELSTHGGPFLRTGDIGTFDEKNHLVICGRLKDLIIINGRNIYPQDLEKIAYNAHPDLIANSAAAFAINVEGNEQIVIVAEAKKWLGTEKYAHILQQVKQAIYEEAEITPYDIVLIPPSTISKTSSGKIQRSTCKINYTNNQFLKVLAQAKTADAPTKKSDARDAVNHTDEAVQQWIKQWLANYCRLAIDDVDINRPFSEFNLNSIAQVQFVSELEQHLNRSIDAWILWQHPNINELSHALTSDKTDEQTQTQGTYTPIAIVGMDCRFPGANDKDITNTSEFWHSLLGSDHAISAVPQERWDNRLYFSDDEQEQGKTYTTEGGFLHSIKRFDAQFFNISPAEAEYLDPQQRLSLQVVWHALEDANIIPSSLKNSDTAIYLGISTHDYDTLIQKNTTFNDLNTYQSTGNSFSTAAGRIAYFLGTQGPCMAIDTACSSSLVTIHQAARALHERDCNLAIAGGVNLILSPEINIIFSKSNMLSHSNRCYTFDERADGYVRGEGCGMVILKRLDDAIADGNKIYAVIHGSAVNQDGASNGLTAPNLNAQIKVMNSALKNAKLSAEQISHIEAHGTGTSLGDPIEWEGIRQVYGENRTQPLYITSLKTRIGHLEAAAGIAGFIKTVLAVQHHTIPAHLNFQQLNSKIKTDKALVIPLETQQMDNATPFYAGVSSFGFSGTNAHIIIGNAPEKSEEVLAKQNTPNLWLLSARDRASLQHYIELYKEYAAELNNDDFATMCSQLQNHRTHFAYRSYIVASDKNQWFSQLNDTTDVAKTHSAVPIAWLFTGQGSLKKDLAKDIYYQSPLFAAVIDECCLIANRYLPYALKQIMLDTPETININDTLYSQPSLFVFEYALARWWHALGIKPDFLMGHSLGEYVAATVAEVMSLEDALKLVCARARLMHQLPVNGSMLAVDVAQDKIKELSDHHPKLTIAARNSPEQTVFSGDSEQINALSDYCQLNNLSCKQLKTSHAFHSPMMQPMIAEFHKIAASLSYKAPKIALISNITGKKATEQTYNADYWCTHILQTVEFLKGVETLRDNKVGMLLELGPAPVLLHLSSLVGSFTTIASMSHPKNGYAELLDAAGQLYTQGYSLNWSVLNENQSHSTMELPHYPFLGKEYWLKIKKANQDWTQMLYQKQWESIPLQASVVAQKPTLLISSINNKEAESALAEQHPQSLSLLTFTGTISNELKKAIEHHEIICFYSDVGERELTQELLNFHNLTHYLITHALHKRFVFTTPVHSLVGQTLIAALQSVYKEQPEWMVTAVDIQGSYTLFWQTITAYMSEPQARVRFVDQQLFKAHIEPMYLSAADVNEPDEANKVYFITGGAGDLGQYFIENLIKQGAKTIIAVGRSTDAKPWNPAISKALSKDINLSYYCCDTSDSLAIKKLFHSLLAKGIKITSIIHAAGQLNDKSWLTTTHDDLTTVINSKAVSAWNIHLATRDLPISEFIMISSLSSVFGNQGQAAYAAANGFLNALNELRIAANLPSKVINFGPIKATGLFKHNENQLTQMMSRQGIHPISKEIAFKILTVHDAHSEIICADLDLKLIASLTDVPLAEIAEPALVVASISLSVEQINRLAHKVLKADNEQWPLDQNWFEVGMDSIMAGQLAFALNKQVAGLSISAKDIFKYAQADKLYEYISSQHVSSIKNPSVIVQSHTIALSLQQQEIWNYLKTAPNAQAYYIPMQVRIKGAVDVADFQQTINTVAESCDVFRYQFDELLHQVNINVLEHAQIAFTYRDHEDKEEVARFMSQDFDLKNGPLARCLLIKECDNSYLWLTVLHHLITDGQSANQFLHNVMTHYAMQKTKPDKTKSYQEYIHWQRDHYFHKQVPELLNEWQIKLKDTPVDVPITQDTGLAQKALVINHTLPIELLSKTQTILASNAITTGNHLLMSLSQMLMKAFNRSKQGIVMFYSGRESGEFTDVFGDLSNDVVICLEQDNNSPIEVLKELQQQIMALTEQQYFRIQLLKDCQLLPEISFDYQNIDKIVYVDEHFSAAQTSFHNVQPFLWGTDPRVLSFKALESEGALHLSLKYRSDKITEEQAQTLLADWAACITAPLMITPQPQKHKALIAQDKASVLQQNLWSLLSNTKEHSPYTIPQIKILAPNSDVDLLEQALNQCIATHAALRTQFVIHNERLNYVIKERAQCTIRVIETEDLFAELGQALNMPIAIDSAPLMNCWLIKQPNQPSVFLLKIHHMIMDGLSAELLLEQIEYYYNLDDEINYLAHDNTQTIDAYQREKEIYATTHAHNEHYYQQLLPRLTELLPQDAEQTCERGALAYKQIPKQLTDKVSALCRTHHISPYAFYLQLVSDAVSAKTKRNEVYVSMVKSNRSTLENPEQIGYFADNAPIIVSVDKGAFISRAKATQFLILETIKTVQRPLLTQDLVKGHYRQPDVLFNYYQLKPSTGLFLSAEHILEAIAHQMEDIPLWNYPKAEQLNFMVRSGANGDSVSILYDKLRITHQAAQNILKYIVDYIEAL